MKKKELKKINESQILIVGLARNCAKTIEKEIYNIDKSFSGFKKKNWFAYIKSIFDIEQFK